MHTAILTVAELTRGIKSSLEKTYPFVWVKGQVTNLSRPGSGHLYFSLKDEEASMSVVWFKGSQRKGGHDPLTGEVTVQGPIARRLKDGMEVACAGRVTVYAPRGAYQLVAEAVQDMGLGRLHVQFEELKKRLGQAGYFVPERKRPLPRHPRRVAVITAPGGAALRDFLRLTEQRGLAADIRVHPVLVQGDKAAGQIAQTLDAVNKQGWAEVAVLIRGGGSLEDLWAFNEEAVAQAVFASRVPVLAGVGHEVDHTIADMTADLRAATPSHAAQLLWPERAALVQAVDEAELALHRAWRQGFGGLEDGLAALERRLRLVSPGARLDRDEVRRDELARRLARALKRQATSKSERLDALEARLRRAYGPEALAGKDQALSRLAERLTLATERRLAEAERRLDHASLRLHGLDPERPLSRGYGLIRVRRTGAFLRGPGDVTPGDPLDIQVKEGEVTAQVVGSKPRRKQQPDKEGQAWLPLS